MKSLPDDNLHVLIVEDDAILLLSLGDCFRDEGFDVVEAGSGEQALDEIANGNRLDAVCTDIQLGGSVTGWDVADACRQRWPEIAVLYASGDIASMPRPVEDSRYFSKPYNPAELTEACRELCTV
ncbi:response regulator [Mesorhizobium sp. L-2-11]|uniref:response regulator n=1 Tax=Mesorhizobium sp. L-2-11 TaxID=2744521 RepID=UPI001926757D|nr:response regulator [Mesorhizobium sp. L-2-11]BCH19689.1 response regulator [Mesorhizobium sp. L-2-11]